MRALAHFFCLLDNLLDNLLICCEGFCILVELLFRDKNPAAVFTWNGGTSNGDVVIRLYDMSGTLAARLSGRIEDGSLSWNGRAKSGENVASGLYMVTVEASNTVGRTQKTSTKMVITGSPAIVTNPSP